MSTSESTCWTVLRAAAAGSPADREQVARHEFKAALLEVVAFHHPGSPAEVEQEAATLLKVLS
jgi:hypothetical protein